MNNRGLTLNEEIKRSMWLCLLLAAVFAFIQSQRAPFYGAKPTRIVLGRDVDDITPTRPGKAKSGYDPYFNWVNYFANVAFSPTNAITQGALTPLPETLEGVTW